MATYSAMLPEAPTLSDQFVADCRTSGDYSPMLFEWYKFVGSLAALVAISNANLRHIRLSPDENFTSSSDYLTDVPA
jgi:hypothetical protein